MNALILVVLFAVGLALLGVATARSGLTLHRFTSLRILAWSISALGAACFCAAIVLMAKTFTLREDFLGIEVEGVIASFVMACLVAGPALIGALVVFILDRFLAASAAGKLAVAKPQSRTEDES